MPESKRKLAAILSADMVGYSRLMGADEEATVSALNDCRAIFKTRIAEHHGRVVDTAGDSVLAEFPSVVEAVRTAVEVQDALARRNEVLSEDRRMLFRIGVNLDDVIEQADGSIYGGGVNVAARLEALAEPGGICVSASAFERVKGKLDQGFEPMGTHEVKNIAEPVQVFRVTPGDAKTQSAGFRGAHEPTHKAPLRGAPTTQRPSSGVKDTRPSIVILPFQNRSRDEEDEYFTDGVTEDVISTLGKLEGLRVIPRASAFQFKGKRPALHELVQLLRVTHVLEGSVRRAGVRLRITVELIETAKGDQVWTERYDRVMADIFDIQDEISQAIAQALKAKLTGATSSAARVHRTENLAAYRLHLKGRQHLYAFSRAAFRQATSCFENALEHDAQYPEPHSGLADAYSLLGILGFVRPQEVMPKAKAEALRALELDETIAEAHTSLALVQFSYDWDFAGAEQSFRRAIELDPAAPTCRVFFGWFLVVCGRSGEGVAEHRTGVDLDPLSPFVNRMLALALLMARDYEAVLVYRFIKLYSSQTRSPAARTSSSGERRGRR